MASNGTSGLLTRFWLWQVFHQLRALLPIVLYMVLFHMLVMRSQLEDVGVMAGGLVAVVVGLAVFLQGLDWGLMPIGEMVGLELPQKRPLWVVLLVGFVLGVGVTFAEPAIASLQPLGDQIDPLNQGDAAAYLWLMMNDFDTLLVSFIGMGVGLGAVVGILRFKRNFSIKPMIYGLLVPCIVLSIIMTWGTDKGKDVLGLAWDCGAVTTGPVTVPIVLALGIGISASNPESGGALSGFGVVTLASLFPVMMVQLLAFILFAMFTPEEIRQRVIDKPDDDHTPWSQETPWVEILEALQAVGPLVAFMLFVLFVLCRVGLPLGSLREKLQHWEWESKYGRVMLQEESKEEMDILVETDDAAAGEYGATVPEEEEEESDEDESALALREGWDVWKVSQEEKGRSLTVASLFMVFFGMLIFNFGIRYGLGELGAQVGAHLPGMSVAIEDMPDSPLYSKAGGTTLSILFAFILGLGATVAEPALNVLGAKVQQLTQGAFTKRLLVGAVCIGVGVGIGLGLAKVVFDWDLVLLLIPAYAVAVVLTYMSDTDFVGVAWDSAGVTTGPVTVPLILSLGVAFGNAIDSSGFGILAMASVGPIISVLLCGLITSGRISCPGYTVKPSHTQKSAAGEEIEL